MDSQLWDYDTLSERLSLKKNTLYSMVSRGQIPHIRMGRRLVRFDPKIIERWLDSLADGQGPLYGTNAANTGVEDSRAHDEGGDHNV